MVGPTHGPSREAAHRDAPALPPSTRISRRPAAAPAPRNPLPIVGLMLDHEMELGLSRTQVEDLERLGLDVMRETIRRQADLT